MLHRHFIAALLLFSPLIGLGDPVIQTLDETLLDPAYPDMRQWAQAGVQLTSENQTPRATIQLQPGDDLAAAVAVPNRIVALAAGTYRVTDTLALANNVVLRGANPFQTKLVLKLRGERPAAGAPWPTGLLLENIQASGIENLTVQFDDELPPPPDPELGVRGYIDNPGGQKDLHVVAVRFTGSQNCWLSNVTIRNSGQHPLILESSSHLTIDGVEIQGVYNKGEDSGELRINGSEFCLLSGLTIAGINRVSLGNDAHGRPSRYNVLLNSRIAMDVRIRHPEVSNNLIQECVIEVPRWHDFPPISLGWNSSRAAGANTTNLIYFCTITRDFASSRSRFSIADDPNQVYQILANSTLKGNVEVHGPAPKSSTLRPVR